MRKRQTKKNTKQTVFTYRGILVIRNYRGEYQGKRSHDRVQIHLPNIECYAKSLSGTRAFIDRMKFLDPEQFEWKELPA